jgi:hypothetical protein
MRPLAALTSVAGAGCRPLGHNPLPEPDDLSHRRLLCARDRVADAKGLGPRAGSLPA